MPIQTRIADADGGAGSLALTVAAHGSPFALGAVGTLFDIDVSGAGSAAVYLAGDATGLSLAAEISANGNDWVTATATTIGTVPGSSTSFGPNQPINSAMSILTSFCEYRVAGALRFRIRITAISGGYLDAHVNLVAGRVPVAATVAGQTADAFAIGGNPVRIGGRGISSSPTVLTSGQAGDATMTLDRRLIVLPGAIPENTWGYAAATGGIVNTTGVSIKAAAASGLRNYLATLHVKNTHATVATEVTINDGASGTALWRGNMPAAMLTGDHIRFDPPLRGTAATLLEAKCVTTGAAVFVNATGWTAP